MQDENYIHELQASQKLARYEILDLCYYSSKFNQYQTNISDKN